MRTVIGQFSVPYSPVRPAGSVAKLFCDLSPNVLNFYSKRASLKLSCTLNCALKRANDLKNDFK